MKTYYLIIKFRHDQDWGDGGITEVVQIQFKLSRKDEFIKSFVQDAITRVIELIKDTLGTEFNQEDLEESNEIYFDDNIDDDWGATSDKVKDEW